MTTPLQVAGGIVVGGLAPLSPLNVTGRSGSSMFTQGNTHIVSRAMPASSGGRGGKGSKGRHGWDSYGGGVRPSLSPPDGGFGTGCPLRRQGTDLNQRRH